MSGSDPVARERSSGFLTLPSTSIGKWSAGLLLLSVALMLLNTLLVMPMTEQRTGLELAQAAFTWAVVLSLVSAGVSGLFALVVKHERSWAVIVAVLLAAVVMGAELVSAVIPG